MIGSSSVFAFGFHQMSGSEVPSLPLSNGQGMGNQADPTPSWRGSRTFFKAKVRILKVRWEGAFYTFLYIISFNASYRQGLLLLFFPNKIPETTERIQIMRDKG